jgi:uncharacterized OsmC-like protein
MSVRLTPPQLKDLYERKADAMARRPRFAFASSRTEVRLEEGLRCEVAGPAGRVVADADPEDGGTGAGPDAGELMRASLGASLAMGYRLWAARLDVPIDEVTLEITCEYDQRGELGVTDDVPVGWRRLVVVVTIASAAPPSDVHQVVEAANRHSPILANLAPTIEQIHHLIVKPIRSPRGNDSFRPR